MVPQQQSWWDPKAIPASQQSMSVGNTTVCFQVFSVSGSIVPTGGALLQSSKGFYDQLLQDSDYVGEDYEVFSSWLGQTESA